MDALSDVLETIRLKSAVYFRSDFSSPWGMEVPKGPFAQFHMVAKGRCKLKMKGKPTIDLFSGDIVIFPFGASHWLADSNKSKKTNGMEVVQSIWDGQSLFSGDKFATSLVCGHFEFDRNTDHPFIKALPDFIHISDVDRKSMAWLESISNLIMQEADSENSGSNIVVNRLAEVLFIHAIRAYIISNKDEKGFMTALKDEKISKALKLIHVAPEKNWTLNSLSSEAGLSRTLFANRFRDMVGETPLTYITSWRILKAKQMLEQTDEPVGIIAEKVGYTSEAAFNRVFKKRVNQTPGVYRRELNKKAAS